MNFAPDYRHIEDAAYNREAVRLPLYEHIVSDRKVSEIIGKDITPLTQGGRRELEEYFYYFNNFFKDHGYDVVPFECCVSSILPGGGALGDSRVDPVIKTREDFEKYPWDELPDRYFATFDRWFFAMHRMLPEGMKAVGGVGNGLFEIVQDLVGYQNLCYMMADDEELYAELFDKCAKLHQEIWRRFLAGPHADAYCMLRFGDDLGYKSNTMLSAEDIRTHILPDYRAVVDMVHAAGKPFLLHSCGNIFNVMDDIIACGIDAKHSNEDQIARFPVWVEKYGDKIGNFGGVDMDFVCHASRQELKEYISDVIRVCSGHGGFAFGTGNSIPDYVPAEGYLNMIEIVREIRGDFK